MTGADILFARSLTGKVSNMDDSCGCGIANRSAGSPGKRAALRGASCQRTAVAVSSGLEKVSLTLIVSQP